MVLGCGPIGLLTCKSAIFHGAKRIKCIIAVDCVGYRLAHKEDNCIKVILKP